MFVKITDDSVDQFPYTVEQLRRDNPWTSFPRSIPLEMLADYGVFPVVVESKPEIPSGKTVDQLGPKLVEGTWKVGWTLRDKTQQELDQEVSSLQAARNNTSVPKAEFVLGLVSLGLLQPEDALASSKGDWPTPMLPFLDYLTPDQATQAQVEWATRTVIWRTNTFVLSLASFLGLSDGVVDSLFGIS